MTIVVFGNAALDVICSTVDRVPRYDSIGFDQASVSAGGCGSNVVIGLRALGAPTLLGACVGDDAAGRLITGQWDEAGVDRRFVREIPGQATGVSIGLVDSRIQPRFIHTPGANRFLAPCDIKTDEMAAAGTKLLHIAGFFVLPGFEDGRLPEKLAEIRAAGIRTSLDVVRSPQMEHPEALWPCLPWIDVLFCNEFEARKLTGETSYARAAACLLERGAAAVVIKRGARGSYFLERQASGASVSGHVGALAVDQIVDTTGCGDAFASGFLFAKWGGADTEECCRAGAEAASRIIRHLGAVTGWRQ